MQHSVVPLTCRVERQHEDNVGSRSKEPAFLGSGIASFSQHADSKMDQFQTVQHLLPMLDPIPLPRDLDVSHLKGDCLPQFADACLDVGAFQ
jgi:hypothetical protein